MYAYMIGKVADIAEDNLVLEVGGIGYNIRIPGSVAALLPPVGNQVKVYTYTSVREDALQLFGFLSRDDLEMYRLLIGVSGIGPKGGLAVMSVMSADELRLAVISQDAKAIAKAPGIGSKTAQRVILELKDKISMEDAFSARESGAALPVQADGLSEAKKEAVEALAALGYPAADALRAVKAVAQEDMDVETLLKAALKKMF